MFLPDFRYTILSRGGNRLRVIHSAHTSSAVNIDSGQRVPTMYAHTLGLNKPTSDGGPVPAGVGANKVRQARRGCVMV